MLKAIVFDFDGVIVDTEPLHYQAFIRVAKGLGVGFDYAQYLERYVGFDDRDGFRAMLTDTPGAADRDAAGDDRVVRLCEQKAQAFEAIVSEGFDPIPGSIELIQHAKDRLPLAIASGAIQRDIDPILGKLGLTDVFDPVVTADDVARSKPDPETYRLAVRGLAARRPDLAIQAAHCLAIEDTTAGIASARQAGLATLGLAGTYPANQLHHAHRVVDSLVGLTADQLAKWFG